MPSIAITGGIATGKSCAIEFLEVKLGIKAFSADRATSDLLDHDPEVAEEMICAFGPLIYHSPKKTDGVRRVDRERLRAHLIENEASKKKIESILHPRLRSLWLPQAQQAKGDVSSLFLAEIPLLYENDLAKHFDHVMVVAASEQKALQRLIVHRGLSSEAASAFIQLQWPLIEKIKHAHQVAWNDGSLLILHQQLEIVVSSLLTYKF